MAKKKRGSSSKTLNTLIMVGVGGAAAYLAWTNNFLGIQDFINGLSVQSVLPTEEDVVRDNVKEQPFVQGITPQQIHEGKDYPFPYPYYPTDYPATAGPTTLSAAHYRIAGTPNIAIPSAAAMPNPSYWFEKGGIMNPERPFLRPGWELQIGSQIWYQPTFSQTRGYTVQGTNISYPYILGPTGPSPCPYGEYRASDGRCYRLQAPPPESCQTGYYRASDGRCYPLKRW